MSKKVLHTIVAIVLTTLVAIPATSRAAEDGLRAYINDSCIVSDEPYLLPDTDEAQRTAPLFGTIAAKLAGALISGAFEGIVGGIRAGGARRDTSYVAASDFSLYVADLSSSPRPVLNPKFGCVTIVAGDIAPGSTDCSDDYIPLTVAAETLSLPDSEWKTDREDNSVENILKRANVCVNGEAKAVYEGRILLSDDQTAFRMTSAGYWINSFISTKSARAFRNVLYTLEIVEPSEGAGGKVLSTAWVDLGRLPPGSSDTGNSATENSEWLRVPSMSKSAKRVYDEETSVHQEVSGKIAALERAIVRDARLLSGIRDRVGQASSAVRRGLEKEATKVELRLLTAEAMLEARHAELSDLPQGQHSYMPVVMRVGVTETRNEKRAMQALATILEDNKKAIVRSANDMIGIERSFDADVADNNLDALQAEYFDAVIALESSDSGEDASQLEQDLARARQSYNSARVDNGLSPLE